MKTPRRLHVCAALLLTAAVLVPLFAAAQPEDGAADAPVPKAPLPAGPASKKPLGPPTVAKAPMPGQPLLAQNQPDQPAAPPRGGARPGAPAAPRRPGAAPAPAGGAEPAGGEDTPRWRQQEEKKDDKPTLGSDFIKNCQRLRPGVRVQLDIYDEDLEAVVKLIACMTGKNIILSESLKGKKITIYSPTQVTADEAYRAFLTALEANGYTLSERGKFLKIIPIKEYDGNPGPIRMGTDLPPNEDRMVTQIVPLKFIDAQEVSEVLSKLATPNAEFIAYAPNNSLIITETGSNMRKLLELIQHIDVAGSEEQVWIYQVLHAEAGDISQKLLEIFEQKQGGRGAAGAAARPAARAAAKPRAGAADAAGAAGASAVGESDNEVSVSKVVADERTNRLIIVATARSYQRIKRLIARLDTEIPGDGQIHIHQLNHAKAADLANVLSNLSQNAQQRQQARRGGNQARPARAAAPKEGAAAAGGGGDGSATLFEGEVQITADEDTNTLVVTSSLKDYMSLKNVIELLDRPRRQVFLEAVVMEVSIRADRRFGIGFHGAVPEVGSVGDEAIPLVFKHAPGELNTTLGLASAANLQGLAVASFGGNETIGGVPIPRFGAILRALATSNDSNILSTPHLLTTDNEEAEIIVGQNVPFVAGFAGGLGGAQPVGGNLGNLGGFFPTVSVQRQDVALTLKITPRINAENYVTLEVEQVIEEVDSIDQQLGPTTSKRSVKTTVSVRDQNTIVIGGLQRDQQLNTESKVPILGEIPILGYLFRDTGKTRERRNLLLLITPHVIEGPEDFSNIFKRKLEEHREFLARFHKEGEGFVVGVDYGKKHGVVEAIHKAVRSAQEEEDLLQQLRDSQQGPPLPQDVDGVPVDGPLPATPGAGGGIPAGPGSSGGDAPAGGGDTVPTAPVPPPPPIDAPAPPPLEGGTGGQP